VAVRVPCSTTELLRRTIEFTEADSERQPQRVGGGYAADAVELTTEPASMPIHG
jgi:hypothetical protein